MRRSIRRGFVAAAAAGLLALGAGSASADGAPADTTAGASGGSATGERSDAAGNVTQSAQHVLHQTGGIAKGAKKTGNGATRDAGKAISHVTQKAGTAVSEAPSASAHEDLGALSGVAAQAAPSSAPGLPEGIVIGIPELVPGVPSIGIVPASLPALPVTPGLPPR